VRSGRKASEIDKVARDIISGYGYGENFTHGLGHGIGVYIHMPPTLSPSSRGVLVKASDMAITIEPGIYLEDRWGVRIEDNILVTWISYERITHSPKKLEDAILRPDSEHVISAEEQFKEPSDPENNTITFIVAVIIIGTVGMIAIPVYMKFFRKK